MVCFNYKHYNINLFPAVCNLYQLLLSQMVLKCCEKGVKTV